MLFFGPVSSADFITFGIVLWGFHAGPALFRTGWFVESLATQTLVIFAIRTRRIPFELGKYWFYRSGRASAAVAARPAVPARRRRVHRRAARFTTG